MDIERIEVGPRMSNAVAYGHTVYLAGVVASDATLDVKGQTSQILDKVDALLTAAGSDKSRLLRANIWLTDISTWAEMNEVWDAWVVPGQTPARATVQAALAGEGLKVEIMIEAAR